MYFLNNIPLYINIHILYQYYIKILPSLIYFIALSHLTCIRICAAMFTTVPSILQVYLNDEPLLSYQPEHLDNQGAFTAAGSSTSGSGVMAGNANGLGGASACTQKLDK